MDTLPPQFVEIVEAVREIYVAQFSETVAGFSEETHVVEPVLLDSEGDIATEGPLRLPYRADYASLETGKLESFTAPREIRFDAPPAVERHPLREVAVDDRATPPL